MHVHLSPELRVKYGTRNTMIRKGDKVRILRGQQKKKEGKVERVSLKYEQLFVTGIDYIKRDGTKIIVISGTDDKRLISECFVKGANEFIEKTPEWHKNILRHIRLLESQKHGNNMEIVSNIEEKERKIVSIEVNNLHRDYVAQELEKELLTHINSGYYNVIIDMKNVFNITSKGINTLISGFKICSENGGEFKLCNVRTSVNEALSYIFLDNALQIHKDKESALNSFNEI